MDVLESLDEVKTLEAASLQALQSAVEDADEPEAVSDEVDYSSMTVVQLKDLLREAGKTVSGKKAELIERLQE
jgi:hypothetical protein